MKKTLFILLFIILIYTRFVGLGWGLPYPMHPDERNMSDAIMSLHCDLPGIITHTVQLKDCLNPHFFAYGQLPLYVVYLIIQFIHLLKGSIGQPITFIEATMNLRILSALASLFNAFLLLKIIGLIRIKIKGKKFTENHQLISLALIIFSPYFIQFAHFGTTELLLMLFYSAVIYLGAKIILSNKNITRDILNAGIVLGIAIGTKLSAVLFSVPILYAILSITIFSKKRRQFKFKVGFLLFYLVLFFLSAIVFTSISSPQSIISYSEFKGSINYESAVATGNIMVFYTRQFFEAIPFLFQAIKIFPYVLGLPVFILMSLGFITLSWKNKWYNFLRLALISYFIPNAFFFAKWNRFLSPIFPVATLFCILFFLHCLDYIKNKKLGTYLVTKILLVIIVVLLILPGVAYLSIYQTPDVRFFASKYIYENVPSGAHILSETANVVDIPVQTSINEFTSKNYSITSFDFYNVDSDPLLQKNLNDEIKQADYIFIPSRRIYMNHTCFDDNLQSNNSGYISDRCSKLKKMYPILNDYYQKLFSGTLGFKKVAEFTSYPRITVLGKTLITLPDENAEETWTVFDHPVIRIYKRINEKM